MKVAQPLEVLRAPTAGAAQYIIERRGDGFVLRAADGAGRPVGSEERLGAAELAERVRTLESAHPRWVWDTQQVYPALLSAGVRVRRAHDLRLARAVLRRSELTAASFTDVPLDDWDGTPDPAPQAGGLFELQRETAATAGPVDELARQLVAIIGCAAPSRIRLLLALESAGALAAAEMAWDGLPWSAPEHDRILTDLAGPRPPDGVRPQRVEVLVTRIRDELHAPRLNPDSAPDLLRSLRLAGVAVESTRSSALQQVDHPVIAPLLQYKKLARLLAANGWHWLDTWVADGRFRPDYLVGGVVTGRWATRGGGALQLPKQIRGAVVADPGWRLVVADAAQLEPRVLAALAGDHALADAGRGRDLYEGIVATGAVPDRASAKYGVLGALYGATSGPGGRLVPRLSHRFPKALGLVEQAARTGERGGVVSTLLGRTAPPPQGVHAAAFRPGIEPSGDDIPAQRARSIARDRGRFTRNFIVQGSAAEWALCWLADLRTRLAAIAPDTAEQPHLVYFLHDEVIVHTPAHLAQQAAQAVEQAAVTAGRTLFGHFPIDFPLDTAIVDRYSDAG
ncbi:bifunctional 3'-5' exonuclease/DNA polymerase [uncultured Amnibacterium sp.]|uniref:bifunctional 3'-5' exonuclease/DNA polymerase n=1 Tax=uncultured Amnibacterium sp. TaxID=1631851 RepID=UPI0035CA1FE2